MGSTERRERAKQELRDKILDAARELFIDRGYENVSMRQIAQKIEYSPTAIYLHFADKLALFEELCREDFRRFSSHFLQAASIPDPLARLRALGGAYVQFGLANPRHYWMMFMYPHPHDPSLQREIPQRDDPAQNGYLLLTLTVQEALENHLLRGRSDQVDLIAQTFWAGIHGLVSLHIAMSQDPFTPWAPLPDRIDAMLDCLLNGFRPDPVSAPAPAPAPAPPHSRRSATRPPVSRKTARAKA